MSLSRGTYGLLGRKLGHSYSPQIHQRLGSWPYALYEREPDEVADFIRTMPWDGINVAAVNTALDLDGNGTNDVCFYTDASKKVDGIANIAVDGSIGLTVADNGGKKQLMYNVDPDLRYWASDNHLILDAIPSQEIAAYKKLGYTLTQNPGY